MKNEIKFEGQIYSLNNVSELKKVKEGDKKEQASQVSNLSQEDELQALGDDFATSEVSEGLVGDDESQVDAQSALIIQMYQQQIQTLQNQKNQLHNSVLYCDSIEDSFGIFDQINDIQSEINNLRADMFAQLSGVSSQSTPVSDFSLNNDTSALSLNSANASNFSNTDTGSNIVNYAESFLGRKNPSRSASGNKFVRVQRGGTCDDFATYVIDNSTDKSNLAGWYNNLSEKEKAWGPDIFRAAREANATVSLKEARSGDLASIDLNNNGGMDHTVIVKEIKDGKVYTIESNGGSIVNKTYKTSQICNIARVIKE